MAISPWYTQQLAPAWTIQLVPDSGVTNVTGLVTSNFSLLIKNSDTNVETQGAGTFSNITAATTNPVTGAILTPASVQYQLAPSDVATPGNYHVWCYINFGNGPEPFDLGTWQILPK